MKNKKGFTLVELMIVMGISAILALITVPSMMSWYAKDKFINQSREIIDMINDARAAALSNKKCSNTNDTTPWSFSFVNNGGKIQLLCNNTSEREIVLNKDIVVNGLEYFKNNRWHLLTLNEDAQIVINFSAGKAIPQISTNIEENSFNTKSIKMTFNFAGDSDTKRTICFDRIAGFPTISKTANCAE